MLLSLEGLEAVGKTTLAYSAPMPIVGFAWDMGFERALVGAKHKELFDGLNIKIVPYDKSVIEAPEIEADITIYELPLPIQLDGVKLSGCADLWSYFIIRLAAAFRDSEVRSIVIDTMTNARRIKADAHLEGLQLKDSNRVQLLQIEYGRVNDPIRDIYTTAQGVRKNLIAVHHLTDEYKESINAKGEVVQLRTGRLILEGFNKTYQFVDCALRMEKDKGQITGKWIKNGYNLSYEGQTVANPTWDSLVNMIEMGSGDLIKLEHRKELATT